MEFLWITMRISSGPQLFTIGLFEFRRILANASSWIARYESQRNIFEVQRESSIRVQHFRNCGAVVETSYFCRSNDVLRVEWLRYVGPKEVGTVFL
ncbi:hypothetical protein TNCV_746661 [Trichonephila clavipes]|nr:hypothetical protein TNCV_746661 [Trichonephila clavipes]